MKKNKIEIKAKKLSWEEKNEFYCCDKKGCKSEGRYKAPKSKLNIRNYYFFCLKHVKEYNKSWDYYKNMSVSQIELSLRQDVIWDRPSWPTKGSPSIILNTINSIFSDNFRLRSKHQKFDFQSFNYKDGSINNNLTRDEQKSLEILDISIPITLEKIKSSYKKLVKKYHPDVNKDDKNAEKYFKEVNAAYKILLKKVLVK